MFLIARTKQKTPTKIINIAKQIDKIFDLIFSAKKLEKNEITLAGMATQSKTLKSMSLFLM